MMSWSATCSNANPMQGVGNVFGGTGETWPSFNRCQGNNSSTSGFCNSEHYQAQFSPPENMSIFYQTQQPMGGTWPSTCQR